MRTHGLPVLVVGLSEAASAVAHGLMCRGSAAELAADAAMTVHRRPMAFADV